MSWRDRLVPASFRGAEFKVDISAVGGGRRIVEHEFPKRDIPYAEDMGRRARRVQVTGYVIGPEYTFARDFLKAALEAEGPGLLALPTGPFELVVVDQFQMRENRRAGGMAEFDMSFSEAGAGGFDVFGDTIGAIIGAAGTLQSVVTTGLNSALARI